MASCLVVRVSFHLNKSCWSPIHRCLETETACWGLVSEGPHSIQSVGRTDINRSGNARSHGHPRREPLPCLLAGLQGEAWTVILSTALPPFHGRHTCEALQSLVHRVEAHVHDRISSPGCTPASRPKSCQKLSCPSGDVMVQRQCLTSGRQRSGQNVSNTGSQQARPQSGPDFCPDEKAHICPHRGLGPPRVHTIIQISVGTWRLMSLIQKVHVYN